MARQGIASETSCSEGEVSPRAGRDRIGWSGRGVGARMYDKIPATLFRTKRGLCPSCGAPLPLGEDASNIACGFCGGRAVLQRRLRRAEPEVEGAPLRQFDAHDQAGWERTDELRETYTRRATCPGCGQGIDEPEHGERFACGACGTECHVERRLVPPARNPLRGVPRPRHPDERYSYELQADEDAQTEHLIWRLSREEDLDRAMVLAAWFERWSVINETTSRLMPALLERMHRAAEAGHRPLVTEISSAVDKCLCSEGVKLRDTIAALEEWVVRVPAEPQLLSSLGLGPAMGLKLLLDCSMLAYKAGDLRQSVAALFGINWMLQRNYPQHPIISQILMHRMFYLSGPPLAFCVMFMHGQVSDVAFRYDPRVTLSFLDDAVAERPCLVPSLDHERAFWCGGAKDEQEWAGRHTFVESLRTDEAKIAAWRWYLWPPEGASAEFYEEYGRKARAMMDHEQPAWRAVGEKRVEKIIRDIKPCPASIMSLVAERGESLPGEIRRAFLGEYDKCGLSYRNLPNWESEPKPQEHPEVVEARRLYKEGLDLHLAQKSDDRGAWKAYWDARDGGRDVAEIFDGESEGPPPPSRGREKRRYPRPWEDGGGADGAAVAGMGPARRVAGSDGRPAPGDETAPPESGLVQAEDAEAELDELLALSAEELAALERTGRRGDADAPSDDDGADDEDDRERDDDAPGAASADSGAGIGYVPNDGSVTIWEYVASLPEEQRGQYDEILRQMEPHRAMIETAIAQQRAWMKTQQLPSTPEPPTAHLPPREPGQASPASASSAPPPPPARPLTKREQRAADKAARKARKAEADQWELIDQGQDRPFWRRKRGS